MDFLHVFYGIVLIRRRMLKLRTVESVAGTDANVECVSA